MRYYQGGVVDGIQDINVIVTILKLQKRGLSMGDEKEFENNYIPIGKEVSIFRTLLNCTQQEFADYLLLNRVTISKLEKIADITQLSPDIAFRLYYATQKIMENQHKEDYVKYHAKTLQSRIEHVIQERITTL